MMLQRALVVVSSAFAEDASSLLQARMGMLSDDGGHKLEKPNADWDAIQKVPCVGFKIMLHDMLLDNAHCVTTEEFVAALTVMGVGPVAQGLLKNSFQAHVDREGVGCLDVTKFQGDELFEHPASTGIVDPKWDAKKFKKFFGTDDEICFKQLTSYGRDQFEKDQKRLVDKGKDVLGVEPGSPYMTWGAVFDLYGETSADCEGGKVMKRQDLEYVARWGYHATGCSPPKEASTVCAEFPLPGGPAGTSASTYGIFQWEMQAPASDSSDTSNSGMM